MKATVPFFSLITYSLICTFIYSPSIYCTPTKVWALYAVSRIQKWIKCALYPLKVQCQKWKYKVRRWRDKIVKLGEYAVWRALYYISCVKMQWWTLKEFFFFFLPHGAMWLDLCSDILWELEWTETNLRSLNYCNSEKKFFFLNYRELTIFVYKWK